VNREGSAFRDGRYVLPNQETRTRVIVEADARYICIDNAGIKGSQEVVNVPRNRVKSTRVRHARPPNAANGERVERVRAATQRENGVSTVCRTQ